VYVLIWLFQNFSTELSNDLAMSKYVVPRGGDPQSPVRDFLQLTAFRVIIVILFIFYINLAVRVFFPHQLQAYRDLLQHWPQTKFLITAAIAAIGQMITMHGFVVFSRLLFLRKRLFV
jgi:hypothetical protein